jgi:hypothetical protein
MDAFLVVALEAAIVALKLVDGDEQFTVTLDQGLAIGFRQGLEEQGHDIPAVGLAEFAK